MNDYVPTTNSNVGIGVVKITILVVIDNSVRCLIVPVVEVDKNEVKVLWMDQNTVQEQLRLYAKKSLDELHDAFEGGKDILVLKRP